MIDIIDIVIIVIIATVSIIFLGVDMSFLKWN